jgi:hypothetical protein
MDHYIKIIDRVYIYVLMKEDSTKSIFVDKMNKINKKFICIKHRVYNEFISHKITYFLILINEFRLHT